MNRRAFLTTALVPVVAPAASVVNNLLPEPEVIHCHSFETSRYGYFVYFGKYNASRDYPNEGYRIVQIWEENGVKCHEYAGTIFKYVDQNYTRFFWRNYSPSIISPIGGTCRTPLEAFRDYEKYRTKLDNECSL